MSKNNFIRKTILLVCVTVVTASAWAQTAKKEVSEKVMQDIYEQVKTPYKYGMVLTLQTIAKKWIAQQCFVKTTIGT